MVYLTCLAHALQRVAEEIRHSYTEIHKLISTVKKMFLKALLRVHKFKKLASALPLPPQLVLTRWGTCLDAACWVLLYLYILSIHLLFNLIKIFLFLHSLKYPPRPKFPVPV
jgi:hypothetical protein